MAGKGSRVLPGSNRTNYLPLLRAHMLLAVGKTRGYCRSRELRATKKCNERDAELTKKAKFVFVKFIAVFQRIYTFSGQKLILCVFVYRCFSTHHTFFGQTLILCVFVYRCFSAHCNRTN
jgi:hypothetical protein